MTALTICSLEIRQIDGLYSLNDLHKASGGEKRHQPSDFIRLDQTQALITELNSEDSRNLNVQICTFKNSEKSLFKPLKVFQGRNGGTYACKELVIAYAAWISPAFHLKIKHKKKKPELNTPAFSISHMQ